MSDVHSQGPTGPGTDEAGQRKLESLAAMATGIAHELNNHLAAVEGNNKILLKRLGPEWEHHAHLAQIQMATQQALDLISELGVYAGRLEPDRQAVQLSELFDQLLPQWEAVASPEQTIAIHPPSACPPLQVDPELLAGAITRLVTNAQDATVEASSTITISARAEKLTDVNADNAYADLPPTPGSYVTIAVQDTGNGISSTVRHRMFDPFFSTKIRGQGMGLPYVIGVARAHQGAVSFSTGASGTCVRIHLPLDAA
jgi:signal transduction histidine kinase